MNKQNLISTPAAAVELGVSPATIRNAHSKYGNYRGIIPIKHFNNRLLWAKSDIEAAIANSVKRQRKVRLHTNAQHQIIIKALRTGPKPTDFFRQLLVYQVGARINELRNLGYVITTHRITCVDRDGVARHRMALYTLESEPVCLVPVGVA